MITCFNLFLEEGQFLALDLGGTNYRVLLITLKTNVKPKIIETTYAIPTEKMCGEGEEVNNFINTLFY